MEALGMIETKGLLASIESADAMLKAAEVRLLERTFVAVSYTHLDLSGGRRIRYMDRIPLMYPARISKIPICTSI